MSTKKANNCEEEYMKNARNESDSNGTRAALTGADSAEFANLWRQNGDARQSRIHREVAHGDNRKSLKEV